MIDWFPSHDRVGVALPLVRRVFGEIVAKDLVSVQPMNLPAGLIFYLDFRYGSNNGNQSINESLYGASADMKTNEIPTQGANNGLYGAGTFGYSINSASITVHIHSPGVLPAADDANTNDGSLAVVSAGVSATGSMGMLKTASSASINYNEDFINAAAAGSIGDGS